jgi:hypothetical protein
MTAADNDGPFQKPFQSACCKSLILLTNRLRKTAFHKHMFWARRPRTLRRRFNMQMASSGNRNDPCAVVKIHFNRIYEALHDLAVSEIG